MSEKSYHCKIADLALVFCLVAVQNGVVDAANTLIHTDNTLADNIAFHADSPGSNHIYTLSEINGKLAGNNLFYSFSDFNIGSTDTVWFNLNSPGLANVINRVTGGFESFIDGQLKLTNQGGTPSFFLINPAGITFSSGASVDVPGSFYVSTASTLNFSDGSLYRTEDTQTSTLSVANPESFGFLGNEVGNLNIGSLDTEQTKLVFQPGVDILFAAKKIIVNNSLISVMEKINGGSNFKFFAPGNVPNLVKLDYLPNLVATGEIKLNNSTIKTTGSIDFVAGFLELNYASTIELEGGMFSGINKSIRIDSRNILFDNQSRIHGLSREVDIKSNFLKFGVRSGIVLGSVGDGNNITISANTIEFLNDAVISNDTSEGNGGSIYITGDSIKFNADHSVRDINITTDAGDGDGGDIVIRAGEIDFNHSWIRSFVNRGKSGDIVIAADSLKMNVSSIDTRNSNGPRSGDIFINSGKIIMIDSLIGNSGSLNRNEVTSVQKVGSIIINTDFMELYGTFFDSQSHVEISNVKDQDPRRPETDSDNNVSAQSSAGGIAINAYHLQISDSTLSTKAFGFGYPGVIKIRAENWIQLIKSNILVENEANDNRDIISQPPISQPPISQPPISQPPEISINSNDLQLRDSLLSSVSTGSLTSGKIDLFLKNNLYLNHSTISTEAKGRGNGGIVGIEAKNAVFKDSEILTSVLNRFGEDGGSIDIKSDIVILNHSFIRANTEAAIKKGGDIKIVARMLIPSESSLSIGAIDLNTPSSNAIQSVNRSGIVSPIDIPSPQLNLSGILANLDLVQFDSRALHRNMCVVDESSSLHQSGKGGLPIRAKDFLLKTLH